MKRRPVWLLGVAAIILAVIFAILYDPSARVQGWLGGEPFFAGRSATAWERDLKSKDDAVHAAAIKTLADGKGDAVPVCVWLLRRSPDAATRGFAADALSKMEKEAAPAAGELVEALSDPDGSVREVVITAVSKLAPNVPGGVPAIVKLFPKDTAIYTIAAFGPAGAEAVPSLIPLLKHPDAKLRWYAGRSLGRIGEAAAPAVPGLVEQLNDTDPFVREHAAEALGQIGPKAALNPLVIPALARVLKDPSERVRRDAVRSLGQLGKAARPVLKDVKALRSDPAERVKQAADDAVKAIES